MIRNHTQFVEATKARKKVSVQFYSKADSGVLDHICAPLSYGPGGEFEDGLNRYWLWDYSTTTGPQKLGLVPGQIVGLQVLGELFDPGQFAVAVTAPAVSSNGDSPPASSVSPGANISSKS